MQNNISHELVEEWIGKLMKNIHNVSIMHWKVVILSFLLIGNGSLVWKVGKASKFRLGEDPWVG